ncbi:MULTISPECIES: hypothetical protein [Halobacterium]|uniref:hypothetical protein n=1 Tax=Halobacterium TaxID=2239 RepID=UPI00073F6E37|nr:MULTISPECIES: hypothetical protein [Halobacterium]MCG1003633.1 hypothetical protein [Halobacterium noricense]
MRPSPRVLLAVLLGVSLFAYPLASPPPDPGEQVHLEIDPAPTDRNYRAEQTYESMSPDAQSFFDAAAPNGSATRRLADAPDPWATQVNESSEAVTSAYVVEYDGTLYLTHPFHRDPGPSATDILTRLGALAVGSSLLAYAGYATMRND